ncbi:MAG: PKD domain-containing protein [Methanothrix sp.]
MEKEVKIALITGIVALLVGLIQHGPALLNLIFPPEINVTTIEVPVNTPPENLSLDSDRISPQPEGIAIMWTASANDKDYDRLFYKFLLRGPSKNFKLEQDWDTENTWTWTTTNEDIGVNSVQVQVRDSNHEPENSYDDKTNKSYTILSRPTANFTYSQPNFGDPVEFDASESWDESGPIILYEWDFDDGEDPISEYEGKVTHTYEKGGVYRVNLTVTNFNHISESFYRDVNVTSTTSYQIEVKTKAVENAESDKVSVYLTLYGKHGEVKTKNLDNKKKNDFERGNTDVFNSGELLDVGDIRKITLDVSSEAVKDDHWQPEWIKITNEKTEKSWTFDITDEVDKAEIYGPYNPR